MPEPQKLSEEISNAPQTEAEFESWLREQMSVEGRGWLLAHADDGVIWGRWHNGGIITSHDVAPEISPALRLVTLQQAFIFGAHDEVRLWRDEGGWLARRISDDDLAGKADRFDEDEMQILWGDKVVREDADKVFTHIREERQGGMDHVVPLIVTESQLQARRLKLRRRPFLTYDENTGEARIAVSRLVSVEIEPEQQEVQQ
jgi:CRISPR-associated protein (TIGR03984 family)